MSWPPQEAAAARVAALERDLATERALTERLTAVGNGAAAAAAAGAAAQAPAAAEEDTAEGMEVEVEAAPASPATAAAAAPQADASARPSSVEDLTKMAAGGNAATALEAKQARVRWKMPVALLRHRRPTVVLSPCCAAAHR